MKTLRITEIFRSLQGESNTVGLPTTFVRLTGCPLRCAYCDTAYAFHGGELQPIDDIVETVVGLGARHVTVTGGEPLAQPGAVHLMEQLVAAGHTVSLETSGAMDISAVPNDVVVVLDLKTPASGEVSRNDYDNIGRLKPVDQVKFVICDRPDYYWAAFKTREYDLPGRVADVLFSPSHEQLEPATLADWILEDRLPVRLQIQLHKYLWGDKPGV